MKCFDNMSWSSRRVPLHTLLIAGFIVFVIGGLIVYLLKSVTHTSNPLTTAIDGSDDHPNLPETYSNVWLFSDPYRVCQGVIIYRLNRDLGTNRKNGNLWIESRDASHIGFIPNAEDFCKTP